MNESVSSVKAHLSAVLKRVAAGEAVTVTDRNKPVARIVPVDQDDLVERAPIAAFTPVRTVLTHQDRISPGALLDAERGDR